MKGPTLVSGPLLGHVRRVVVWAGAIGAGVGSIGLASLVVTAFYYVHINREHLPDLGAFTRFDFPTVGRIYDANGLILLEVAREYRDNVQYSEIPPVVRAALLAAEDKHFFQHDGIDYSTVPRVLTKVRIGALIAPEPASAGGRSRGAPALFPQGGSTLTQQLVRGVFLQQQKAQERLAELRSTRPLFRALAWFIGARNVNIGLRKGEEMRLSLWIERQMRAQFGSKRRAKEEIFARYVSFVYMGSGQYGFARAAEY